MGIDQGAIDVDDDLVGCCPSSPRPSPRRRPSRSDPAQAVAMDRVEHPPHRRIRRHHAKQLWLLTQHGNISQAVTAIGEHHRQLSQHNSRIVCRTATTSVGHRR
jgi:hypothetical protein